MLKEIKDRILNFFVRKGYYRRDKHFVKDLLLPELTESEIKTISEVWSSFRISKQDLIWARINKKENGFSPYFMCDYQYYLLLKKINPLKQLGALQNKAMCDVYFPQMSWPPVYMRSINGILYDAEMNCLNTDSQILSILSTVDKAIIKPSIDSGCGKDVKIIKEFNIENIKSLIRQYNGNFVLQKLLSQHDEVKKMNPTSLNTCRFTSIFIKGKFRVSAILKIGKLNSVLDNWHSSILVGVNENGFLNKYGYDFDLKKYEKSDTGIYFYNFKIPYFKEMLEYVEKSHRRFFPNAGVVGWDIVVDNDGKIIVIEINLDFPGILGEQLVTCPFLEDYCKEINDIMCKN